MHFGIVFVGDNVLQAECALTQSIPFTNVQISELARSNLDIQRSLASALWFWLTLLL
jgi:hypothetical protein